MMTQKLNEAYRRLEAIKSHPLYERLEAQNVEFEPLSMREYDALFTMLVENNLYASITAVDMGLNTTKGDPGWEDLKQKIREVVERDGICEASWSCTGRTRHQWQSQVLAEDMPEYDFNIGYNYQCTITRRNDGV